MSDRDDWEFAPSQGNESETYGPMIMCVEEYLAPPHKQVFLSDLVRQPHKYVHEVMKYDWQWLKPHWDKDKDYDTEEEMQRNKWSDFEDFLTQIRAVIGNDARLDACEACGYKVKKRKWRNSFHITANGAGAFRCGADMIRVGLIPDGFDKQPYGEVGSRRSMRMPGQSALGENRPLKFIVKRKDNGKWDSIDIWGCKPESRRVIMEKMLIQVSEGEQILEVVKTTLEEKNKNVNK